MPKPGGGLPFSPTGGLVAYSAQDRVRNTILDHYQRVKEMLGEMNLQYVENDGQIEIDLINRALTALYVLANEIRAKKDYPKLDRYKESLPRFLNEYYRPLQHYLIACISSGRSTLGFQEGLWSLEQYTCWFDLFNQFLEDDGIKRFERQTSTVELEVLERE